MNTVTIHEQFGIRRLAPGKSNMTKIHLSHSNLTTKNLCAMIDHCKVLEEFKYTTGGRDLINGNRPLSPKPLRHSLSRHMSTLRVLDLDVNTLHYRWNDNRESLNFDREHQYEDSTRDDPELRDFTLEEYISYKRPPPQRHFGLAIGSAQEFTALTHLSIDITFILGDPDGFPIEPEMDEERPSSLSDLLPPNLEYLCLRGYKQGENKVHTECVSELLDNMAERLPRLKEVHGIREYIPISKNVEDPDDNEELLWNEQNDWRSDDDSDRSG